MKFSSIVLVFIFALMSSCNKETIAEHEGGAADLKRTAHIDVTIQTLDGCNVHIKGVLDYDIIPPSINGFTGTVEVTGPPCDDVIYNFGMNSGNNDMTVTLSDSNPCDLESVEFVDVEEQVPNDIIDALNESSNNQEIVAAIIDAACEE